MRNGLADIKNTINFIKYYPYFLFYHGSLDI